MARHVVAPLAEIPPGSRKLVETAGRPIVIFNVGGRLFAVSNRCPHAGGSLQHAKQVGLTTSTGPGEYAYTRKGEIIRCPWHGWEFDLATGKSWCDPGKVRVKNYAVSVEPGAKLVEGPYTAETFQVSIENDYIVVDV
jgi:3-phenylpropionate/trans-cinnamate dioxygenase ferredoxin subunit